MDETLGDAPEIAETDDLSNAEESDEAGVSAFGFDGGALAIAALVLATGALLLNLTSLQMGSIATRYVNADGTASEVTTYVASIVPGLLLLGPAALCALLALLRARAGAWQRPVAGAALIVCGVVVLVLAISVLALWAAPEAVTRQAF